MANHFQILRYIIDLYAGGIENPIVCITTMSNFCYVLQLRVTGEGKYTVTMSENLLYGELSPSWGFNGNKKKAAEAKEDVNHMAQKFDERRYERFARAMAHMMIHVVSEAATRSSQLEGPIATDSAPDGVGRLMLMLQFYLTRWVILGALGRVRMDAPNWFSW